MDRIAIRMAVSLLTAAFASILYAQQAKPFKPGTFERQGKTFVGIVLNGTTVIDFASRRPLLPATEAQQQWKGG